LPGLPPCLPLIPSNKRKQKQPRYPDKLGISQQILDSCRQSLLPGRFSQCVIAVSRGVDKNNPSQALQTCLSAEGFPQVIIPQLSPKSRPETLIKIILLLGYGDEQILLTVRSFSTYSVLD
jgi:hypothetical protein